MPIYVGRAQFTKSSSPSPLFSRLREQRTSINAASNLAIEDFRCRFLVLHPLWVSTVEDLLIQHYATLWNNVVEGFGIHDPGGKRHEGEIPLWDALHPGRSHHQKMLQRGAQAKPMDDLLKMIHVFTDRPFEDTSAPSTVTADQIIRSSIQEEVIGYEVDE